MTRSEAEELVRSVRERILALFPDGQETYELVYSRRFRRLIDEFAHPRGVVLPFTPRRS